MASTKYGNAPLVEATAGNETLANTWLAFLEYVQNGNLLDDTLTAPPGSPAEGDLYLVAASPTGAWTGQAGKLALYLNGWRFYTPKGGLVVFNVIKKAWHGYSSVESAWHPLQKLWSATEHWTGEYRGTKKVYSKTLTFAPSAGGLVSTAHGISTLDYTGFIGIESSVQDATNTFAAPQPQFGAFLNASFEVWIDNTNVNVMTLGLDYSATAMIFVRLTYTK